MATDHEADAVFKVAELLATHGIDNNDEAALRSAVSRGYYSVFLAAHRRSGCTDKDSIHSRVRYACRNALGIIMTDALYVMLELRVAADYFQDPNIPDAKMPLHDTTNWAENWAFIKRWSPSLRAKLVKWRR